MYSCRFVYIDYISDRGDFSAFYLDPTSDGEGIEFRSGAGMFHWLKPFEDSDWSRGQCVGYTELQREQFSDLYFEVARIFAIISVVGGVGMVCWIFFLSCISMVKCQIVFMSLFFLVLMGCNGMTFLLHYSDLCLDLVSYQNEAFTTICTVDQGGLVVIAAAILWLVAFLITVIYVRVPKSKEELRDERRQDARDKRLKQLLADQKREQNQIRQKNRLSKSRGRETKYYGSRESKKSRGRESRKWRGRESRKSRGRSRGRVLTTADGATEVALSEV